MKVLRVLNNNVVLASRDDGTTVVLTGLGLGFNARPGDQVNEANIRQTFVPENNRDTDNMGELLAAIPQRFVDLAARVIAEETAELDIRPGSATVIALADHVAMAVRRVELTGPQPNPLTAEVAHLYPQEYAAGQRILAATNAELEVALPDSEATAIALHLVNAGFMTEDLAETYRMTGVFTQLFEVINTAFDIQVDQHSVAAARFITHMRYFFVRAHDGRQLSDGASVLMKALETSNPEAVACAYKLEAILTLRLGHSLTDDELAYLSLHVARLVSE